MSLSHHKLMAWQRADDFFIKVHRITHTRFPVDEKFALGAQIRRSAYSVPANIVEGNSRDTDREKLRFFNIASGSLSETGYGLHAARRRGYLSDEVYAQLEAELRSVSAPLHGLIREKRRKAMVKVAARTGAVMVCMAQVMMWI